MDSSVPKENITPEMDHKDMSASTDKIVKDTNNTEDISKADIDIQMISSSDVRLKIENTSTTENIDGTTVKEECSGEDSSSTLYDKDNGIDSKPTNDFVCCIEDCTEKGVSGPYLRAPRGLSDKGYVLKRGLPRPVYFCTEHLAAIMSKHKRKIPTSHVDKDEPYENNKIDRSLNEKKTTEQKKDDSIKSRLRTRGSSTKSFDQLIAEKYLEDFDEPVYKKHCTNTRRSGRKQIESSEEESESENSDSSMDESSNKEKSKDITMGDESSDELENDEDTEEEEIKVETSKGGKRKNENIKKDMIPENDNSKKKSTIKQKIAVKEEESKEEKEKENKSENGANEKTPTKRHQKERKPTLLPENDYKKYSVGYDFTGKTCWRRGCNRQDQFLKLLLPFQVCTCKNHSEKVEGLLIKALLAGKIQEPEKTEKCPDRTCGICGNPLTTPESISCGQAGCHFAFCRSCTESIFLHDNMHSPIKKDYDSFEEIKENESTWACWVCQSEARTKEKRYRETYLNALIAKDPKLSAMYTSSSLQQTPQQPVNKQIRALPPPPITSPQQAMSMAQQPQGPQTLPTPKQEQAPLVPLSPTSAPLPQRKEQKEQTHQHDPERRQRRHYVTRRETREEAAVDDNSFGIGTFRRLSARQVKLKLRSEATNAGGIGGNGSGGSNGVGGGAGAGLGNGIGGSGSALSSDGRRKDDDEELTPLRRMCEGLVEIACFWSDTAKDEEEMDMVTHIFDIARELYTRPGNLADEEWMRDDIEGITEGLRKSEIYLKMLVDRPKHSKSSEATISRLKSLSKLLAGHVHSVDSASEACTAFMKELSAETKDRVSEAKKEFCTAKTNYRIYHPKVGREDGKDNSSSDDDNLSDEDEAKEAVSRRRRGRRPKYTGKNPLEQKYEALTKQLRKDRSEIAKKEEEVKELERRIEKGQKVFEEDIQQSEKELSALENVITILRETSEQFGYLKRLVVDYIKVHDKYTEDFERKYKSKERRTKIKERANNGMPKGNTRLVAIYHPGCLVHRVRTGYSYSDERLRRVTDVVKRMNSKGLIGIQDRPNEAHHHFIGKVHRIDYIKKLVYTAPEVANSQPVRLYPDDEGSPCLSAYSLKAATLSAGTVLEAVSQIASGEAQIAFCVTLPDASRVGRSMTYGSGFLNDIAIGIEYLKELVNAGSIAIVDLDATQGCGTLEIFADRPGVTVFSVQCGFPNEGLSDTQNTRNMWVSRGCSGSEWLGTIARNVAKPLREMAPGWVFINMGFNGLASDPSHLMKLTAEDYARATDIVMTAVPNAGVVSVLGGGFAPLDDLENAVERHIETLLKYVKDPLPPLPLPQLLVKEGEVEEAGQNFVPTTDITMLISNDDDDDDDSQIEDSVVTKLEIKEDEGNMHSL